MRREAPPIDILVNNAGTIARAPAAEHPDELWDRVLEVNLTAQFVLSRELGRDMLERGSGKIVFIASLLSFQGGINVPGYTASKGGVAGLTKALANEWAGTRRQRERDRARATSRTDNTQALRDDPDRYEQILARIPAGRWAEPEDIAGAIVFLASPASDYVHGGDPAGRRRLARAVTVGRGRMMFEMDGAERSILRQGAPASHRKPSQRPGRLASVVVEELGARRSSAAPCREGDGPARPSRRCARSSASAAR